MGDKLKIWFVHPNLGIGGAEKLIVDAAFGMQEAGHSVSVLTSHFSATHSFAKTASLRVFVAGSWLPNSIFGGLALICASLKSIILVLWAISTMKLPDIIVIDQLALPVLAFNLLQIPTIFYCHFPDFMLAKHNTPLLRMYRWPLDILERISTLAATRILVNSKFTKSALEYAFVPANSPVIVYPCIDENSLTDYSALPILDVGKRSIFLSINRFERKKEVEKAIFAFANMKSSILKQSILLIAGGYDPKNSENISYLSELQKIASKYGLEHNVYSKGTRNSHLVDKNVKIVFVPSFNDEMKRWMLTEAKVLLYTPQNEHFGIVPIEAMYMRCPVIACNSGGPMETIVHGVTGFLCDDGDVAKFTAYMELFCCDKIDETEAGSRKWRMRMGESGREHVKSLFGSSTFLTNLENIILVTAMTHEPKMFYHNVFKMIIMTLSIIAVTSAIYFWSINL